MSSRTGAQHDFAVVPQVQTPRSVFNRSCGVKTAFDSGFIVPFFIDDGIPGDTFNLSMNHFARMATPVHPFFDNAYLDVFFFAVPLRLIWDNFQEFMGEEVGGPGTLVDRIVPQLDGALIAEESLGDYFGIPPGNYPAGYGISALPFRAYNLVYNEWFRDQNLCTLAPVATDDGPDDWADYNLLRRGKRHDYFTSSLPWLQKGSVANLPLQGTLPVTPLGGGPGTSGPTFTDLGATETAKSLFADAAGNIQYAVAPTAPHLLNWSQPNLEVDLADATNNTINAIRNMFAVQRLHEKNARGGTRYTEIIRSHFGVISPDQRLQRPEYLGGYSSIIAVNPVASTAEAGTNPQGNLAAFATSAHRGRGFVKSFTEHVIIVGVMNVRADLNYQQGIPKQFLRSTKFDYYWPSLAHLGEQAIESREIYADGTGSPSAGTLDYSVFGYIPRYDEYRFKPSVISGKMRSQSATSLDVWHLAQEFSARPTLNQAFIEEDPPIARVVATPSEPEFLFDAFISLRCARPMPMFGIPGMMDHF